jgi:hypothetical protein
MTYGACISAQHEAQAVDKELLRLLNPVSLQVFQLFILNIDTTVMMLITVAILQVVI